MSISIHVKKSGGIISEKVDMEWTPQSRDKEIPVNDLIFIKYSRRVLRVHCRTSGAAIVTIDLTNPKNPQFGLDAGNFPVIRLPPLESKKRKEAPLIKKTPPQKKAKIENVKK
jgi:hypothetical protein